MIGRNILITILILAIFVGVVGYSLGRFSLDNESLTTTTTLLSTKTQTTTTTVTITEKKTETNISTTTIVRELPDTIPSPANSKAIIRGYLLLNGNIFVTLSIDNPEYSPNQQVYIKATATNLKPMNVSLTIDASMIWIVNSTGKRIWAYPESTFIGGLGSTPVNWIELGPEETISLAWATTDWNMTGLQEVRKTLVDRISIQAIYNDHPVPEGQYSLIWAPQFRIQGSSQSDYLEDVISFIIAK